MVKEFGHAVLSKQTLDDVKGVCFAKAKLAYGFFAKAYGSLIDFF